MQRATPKVLVKHCAKQYSIEWHDHVIDNKLLSGGGKQISLRSIMIIFFRLMTWYCVKIIPSF